MAFWARQGGEIGALPNGALPAASPTAEVAIPGASMADQVMRKMTGIGLSDVQAAAQQAGDMLADFRQRLDRIEANQTEILAQLAYLAARGPEKVQK